MTKLYVALQLFFTFIIAIYIFTLVYTLIGKLIDRFEKQDDNDEN